MIHLSKRYRDDLAAVISAPLVSIATIGTLRPIRVRRDHIPNPQGQRQHSDSDGPRVPATHQGKSYHATDVEAEEHDQECTNS